MKAAKTPSFSRSDKSRMKTLKSFKTMQSQEEQNQIQKNESTAKLNI